MASPGPPAAIPGQPLDRHFARRLRPRDPGRGKVLNPSAACDLHTHTIFSDGALTPEELVRAAKGAGLDLIAVTDHDITDGIQRAREEGRRSGLEVLPGIELSASAMNSKGYEVEMHILGFLIRHEDEPFQKRLAGLREERSDRIDRMIAKLASLNIKLDVEKIKAHAGPKALGRPHIARALHEAGYVSSVDEAFTRYLKEGCPAYVARAKVTPSECIQMIKRAGGVAVVAHPCFGGPSRREEWEKLVEAGLDGIEAFHSQHSAGQGREYEKLAGELGLLVTGGSDFHAHEGAPKQRLGRVKMPYAQVEAILKKAAPAQRG